MAECPYCRSTIEDDNPALLADRIDEALKSQWHKAELDSTYGWPIGAKVPLPFGVAEVAAKKTKALVEEMSDGYYYGGGEELPQGTTFKTFVVLKVGENFFRKEGEGDSYSEIVWAGPVKPVTPKTETRVVYTFG